MDDLRLYLLGTPQIEYHGNVLKIERRKALALVAYLALGRQPQSREIVANLLWPDLDDKHALSALRSTLHALTAPVPIKWIQADRRILSLSQESMWVDVNAFVSLLARGNTHGHKSDVVCDKCSGVYKQATELYRADFLAGYNLSNCPDYDDWQLTQREWLRREYADTLCRLSFHYADVRDYDQAIKYAHLWLAVDPLHEPAHRQLMRLYAANGQRSEALRQYRQCVTLLDIELATPPESETTQLYETIQNDQLISSQDVIAGTSTALGVMPPIPSLVIGREEALHEVKRRLGIGGSEMRGITLIQGWPGVGKSTLVSIMAHDRDIAQHFPDGVLWASLGENPSILNEISTWADAFGLNEPGPVRKVEEISAHLTAVLRDRRMLLIVDDIWHTEHALPFRVGGQMCALVMTSRLNDVANALAPTASDIYRLPVLSETSAFDLLGRIAPETVAKHPNEAHELVRDLEGLPLAIHVAGRLLHSESHMGWGVKELLSELRTGAGLLRAQAPSDMLGFARETSPTIAALLKRSTDLLDIQTRQHFAYLGLFVPKPATFHLDAMAVAWDVADPKPIARAG